MLKIIKYIHSKWKDAGWPKFKKKREVLCTLDYHSLKNTDKLDLALPSHFFIQPTAV